MKNNRKNFAPASRDNVVLCTRPASKEKLMRPRNIVLPASPDHVLNSQRTPTRTMPIKCPPPANRLYMYEECDLEYIECKCKQSTWTMYHRIANSRKIQAGRQAISGSLTCPPEFKMVCNDAENSSGEEASRKIPLQVVCARAEEGVFDIDL